MIWRQRKCDAWQELVPSLQEPMLSSYWLLLVVWSTNLIWFHINSITVTIGSVFPNAALVHKLDVNFLVIEVSLLANSMTAREYLSKCKSCYSLDPVSPFVVTVDTPQNCKPEGDIAAGEFFVFCPPHHFWKAQSSSLFMELLLFVLGCWMSKSRPSLW